MIASFIIDLTTTGAHLLNIQGVQRQWYEGLEHYFFYAAGGHKGGEGEDENILYGILHHFVALLVQLLCEGKTFSGNVEMMVLYGMTGEVGKVLNGFVHVHGDPCRIIVVGEFGKLLFDQIRHFILRNHFDCLFVVISTNCVPFVC